MWNTITRTVFAVASLGMLANVVLAAEPTVVNRVPTLKPAVQSAAQLALIGPEDCQDFSPNSLLVAPGYGWTVRSGGMLLLKSYASKTDAEHAKNVIQHYGFTQQCFVGRMPGEMMYWKASGQFPKQMLAGEDCRAFPSGSAFVSNAGGTWLVMAGLMPVARYVQTNRTAAERAVALIKAYKFTRVCQIVRPQSQMTYWLVD